MSKTVVFEVKSTIGFCHVKVDDDLSDKKAVTKAKALIDENGPDEPSRGILYYPNDDAYPENDFNLWDIHENSS